MEYITTQQQPVPETDFSDLGTPILIKTDLGYRKEEYFKVFDIPRNLQVEDTHHYMPHLANDPQVIAKRRQAKPGERMQHQLRNGLEIGARLVMGSVEPESSDYLADLLSAAMLNSAWYERFGTGRGARQDSSVMRSPVNMPEILIDPTNNLQEYQLRDMIAKRMLALSEVAEIQAGVINALKVRSDERAMFQHKSMGHLSVCLSALRDFDAISSLKTKKDRAERIREAAMQTSRNAQLMHAQIGQHPSIAALAEPLSDTVISLRKSAPTKTTEATIEFAYMAKRAA